jgi:hypothetical protein
MKVNEMTSLPHTFTLKLVGFPGPTERRQGSRLYKKNH